MIKEVSGNEHRKETKGRRTSDLDSSDPLSA